MPDTLILDRNGMALSVGDTVQMQATVISLEERFAQVRLIGKYAGAFTVTAPLPFLEAIPKACTEARYITTPDGKGAQCRFCGKVVTDTRACCDGVGK